MDTQIKQICTRHHLSLPLKIQGGNICDGVYRVTNSTYDRLVLKVGTTDRTKREIKDNTIGYENMKQLGLDTITPWIEFYDVETEAIHYILMEDLGPNFVEQSVRYLDPLGLYRQVINGLKRVYKSTLQESPLAKESIVWIANKCIEQYEQYLGTLDPLQTQAKLLEQVLVYANSLNPILASFSSWDFTPEDVYVKQNGFMYADPHRNVIGIPIIDLACFGGVARDAYNLSCSSEGYEKLFDFAKNHVGPMFELQEEDTIKVFNLGRVLQCFLSARFRMDTNPEDALRKFEQGKEFIAMIVH